MPLTKNLDNIEQAQNPAPVPEPNHFGTVWKSDCLNLVPTIARGSLPERLCNTDCFCLPAFTSPPNIKSYGSWFFVWSNATFFLQKSGVDVEQITNTDSSLDINYLQQDFENPFLTVIRLNWDYVFTTYGAGKYQIRANSSGVDAFSICWNLSEFDCDNANGHIYIENTLNGLISDPFSNNFQFDFRSTALSSFFWLNGKCIVDSYEHNQTTFTSPINANSLASNERLHESDYQKPHKILFGMNGFDGDFLDLLFSQLGSFNLYDFSDHNPHTIAGKTFIKSQAPSYPNEPYHIYTNLLVNCELVIKEQVRGNKFVSNTYI